MIRVEHLTKKYGSKVAVNDLSFELRPGAVTGFLGPNGSGKSTTMRCIVGLDRPTSGRATIGGKEYRELASPLTTVGALLDGKAFHRKRSARQHLANVARTHGFPLTRVDEVLALTGLAQVASKKVGGFSLGMSQRLGIAGALLGDPQVLLFDEPVNGLDPDGVRWVRNLMRSLAAEGRTVLVSSHLMSEMALTADDLIVIGRGELIAQGPIAQFTASAQRTATVVAGPDTDAIERAVASMGAPYQRWAADESHPFGLVTIVGVTGSDVGPVLHAAGCELHELSEIHSSLEDVYMELTSGALEYSIGGGAGEPAQASLPSVAGTPAAGTPVARGAVGGIASSPSPAHEPAARAPLETAAPATTGPLPDTAAKLGPASPEPLVSRPAGTLQGGTATQPETSVQSPSAPQTEAASAAETAAQPEAAAGPRQASGRVATPPPPSASGTPRRVELRALAPRHEEETMKEDAQ